MTNRKLKKAAATAIERLELRTLLAATINPIDVDTSNASSNSGRMFAAGGIAYFYASGPSVGRELWRSDGTAAGTTLVKDINPGAADGSPFNGVDLNGVALFAAKTAAEGIELWRSDGTEAGTSLVKDIRPGTNSGGFENPIVVGNTVFFTATDATHGTELWRTDGTAAGTQMVKDADAGFLSTPVFATLNNVLYYAASTTAQGRELWRSDGTDAGTYRLTDLYAGGNNGLSGEVVAYDNAVYFYGTDNTTPGTGLYRSDGVTVGGATLVKTLYSGHFSTKMTVLNNRIWFAGNEVPASTTGMEPWVSDGTPAGTFMLKDVNPGSGNGVGYEFLPVAYNGATYFASNTSTGFRQLWRSDGTPAGTALLKSGNADPRTPSDFTVAGNGLMFFAAAMSNGQGELWRTDGTDAGTVALDVETTGPSAYPAYIRAMPGGGVIYRGTHTAQGGTELWRSDGTLAGTARVKDIYTGSGSSMGGSDDDNNFATPVVVNGRYFFHADDFEHGVEPWASDGTDAGTALLKDFADTPYADYHVGYLRAPVKMPNGQRVFVSRSKDAGVELFTTDGVTATLLKDVYPGSTDSDPSDLVLHNGILYFTADAPSVGREVWRTDGTAAGTFLLKDVYGAMNNADATWLTGAGPYLYFSAISDFGVASLWRSDGTVAGTVQLMTVSAQSGKPSRLFAYGDKLLFNAAATTSQGRELYVSDGTVAGTKLVQDLNTGPSTGSDPSGFTFMGGQVYFSAYGMQTTELYRTDGTPAGTAIVKDIAPGLYPSNPSSLTAVGNRLFFTASDDTNVPNHGRELWVTDGTDTHMVKDINPGAGGGAGLLIGAAGDKLLFAASSGGGGGGPSLWLSDGTEPGTAPFVTLPASFATTAGLFRGGDLFYFQLAGANGTWRTDGTAAGTFGLGFTLDTASGYPVYIDGKVYAASLSPTLGRETAYTDGTPAGSGFIDLNPGPADGRPNSQFSMFAVDIDGTLWFQGNDGTTGTSLFRMADFAEVFGTTLKLKLPPTANGGSITLAPQGASASVNRDGEVINLPLAGFDAIDVAGSAGNDTITLGVGKPLTFNGGGVSSGGFDSLRLTGNYTLNNDAGAGGSGGATDVVVLSGSVTFNTSQHLHSLQLTGGSATLASGGSKVLDVQTFTRGGSHSLDLSDNDLIVRSGDRATIENWINAAHHGGDWAGNGIKTTRPDAIGGLTTLGVARASDVLDFASPTATATFAGETVTGSAILVKYTYAGDANLDGVITGDDYSAIDFAIQVGGATGYFNGDFNHDGVITGDDYSAIDFNLLAQGAPL